MFFAVKLVIMRFILCSFILRHFKCFMLMSLVLLQPFLAHSSSYTCHELFLEPNQLNSKLKNRPQIHVANQVPKQYERLIRESIEELVSTSPIVLEIPKLSFYVDTHLAHSPATSDFYSDRIDLSSIAFKLNAVDFKSLLYHEITHLLVIRKFRIKSSDTSNETIYQAIQRYKGDTTVGKSHMPYAELLCDTSAVLITRDPKAISNLLEAVTIQNQLSQFTDSTKSNLQSNQDLNSRDFSIDPNDSHWKAYQPRNIDHNRFNQVRSYLWHRWISKLPPNLNAEFYKVLQNELEHIHIDTMFDKIYYSNGLYESNKILIDHLEKKLSEIFPEI